MLPQLRSWTENLTAGRRHRNGAGRYRKHRIMADQTLRAIITVLDRTAAPLHAINARFAAMSAPLRTIGDRLGTIAEESGLATLATRARGALGEVRNLTSGVVSLAGSLTGLAAVGGIAGIFEMLKSTAVQLEAQIRGVGDRPPDRAVRRLHCLKEFGADAEQLDRGIQRLNRNIALAAMGKAKDVERLLGRMGLHNTAKQMLAPAAALEAINKQVTALVAGGKPQLASALLGTLMGARSGMRLQPLFAQAELLKKVAEAAKYGIAPTQKETDDADAFRKSLEHVAAAIFGVELAAGGNLYAALTKIAEGMADWTVENRKWLVSDPAGPFQRLKAAITAINWDGLKAGLTEAGGILKTVFVDTLGVKGTLIAIGLIKFQPLIIALAGVGWQAVETAAIITAAFLATPIGLGIALAGAGAVIGLAWGKNWEIAKQVAAAGWGAIKRTFDEFWSWLGTWASGIAATITAPFKEAFGWIASHMPHLPGFGGAGGHTDAETGGWVPAGAPALSAVPRSIYSESGGGQLPTQKSAVRVDLNLKPPPGVTAEPKVTTQGQTPIGA